jgi:hypothetical protein
MNNSIILKNLEEAKKKIKTIDHIFYVTFPLIKDKKILLKTLVESKLSIMNCINSILQYEYLQGNTSLSQDSKQNFRIFIEKCSPKYKINSQEIKKIFDLFELVEKHKKSPFEFVKDNKIIILSENMQIEALTLEKTKEFLVLAKEILKKTQETIISKV